MLSRESHKAECLGGLPGGGGAEGPRCKCFKANDRVGSPQCAGESLALG